MLSLNENIAGVWELHPVVERSTLRRSVVNFRGTSFDSAALLRPPLSDVAPTGTKREDCGARLMATTSLLSVSRHLGTRGQQRLFPSATKVLQQLNAGGHLLRVQTYQRLAI
jgi:hypothetical protein